MSRVRTALALAAVMLVAACSSPDGDESANGTGDEEAGEQDQSADEEPDLEDPNEQVSGGAFRGEGLIVPALDGWRFDEFAYAQGLVVAANEEGDQQIVGQAVSEDDLPEGEELDFEELVELNLGQFDQEPDLDRETEIDGAVQARQLRYDALPPQAEGQEPTTVTIVAADDGEGTLAVFNYAAAAEDYDPEHEERFLEGIGFDPDSEPTPPEPAPQPTPAPEDGP